MSHACFASGCLGIYLYHVIPSEESGGQAASPWFPLLAAAAACGLRGRGDGAAAAAAAGAAAERAPMLQDDLDMCVRLI